MCVGRRFHLSKLNYLLSTLITMLGLCSAIGQELSPEQDTQTLTSAKVDTSADGLLRFFQKRILTEEDSKTMETYIQHLDSKSFQEREDAVKALVLYGRASLPYLEKAKTAGSLESRQRAQQCIQQIERVSSPDVEAAAVRRLAHLKPEGTLSLLLDFYAAEPEDWVRGEILASVGRIGVNNGKVDPALLTVLVQGKPAQKAAAAFIIAQRGGLDYRADVRKLLTDPNPQVRDMVTRGFLGSGLIDEVKDKGSEDDQMLRANNVKNTQQGIIEFLRRRSLSTEEQDRLKSLITKLGHPAYATREKSFKAILDIELPAVGFLMEALSSDNPEIVQRAEMCIWEIRKGPGPALPEAAVRILARYPSQETIEALIAYLPFAPDESVEQQAIESLCLLSTHQEKVADALVKALHDPLPARKSAAAYVLGRVGTEQDCRGLEKILQDPHLTVKYRTAFGLLSAKNKQAVPTLIDLLDDLPNEKVWEIEEALRQVAGDTAPKKYVSTLDPNEKADAVKAWQTWWATNKGNINLNNTVQDDRYLGVFTVCEYDNPNGRVGGRVWECGRDGNVRWEINNVMGPMDARVLKNGRVLIAESNSRKVTERDKTGKIMWEYNVPNNPVTCQRLPNGNTFIATYRDLMEVTPDKRVVYNHNKNQGIIYYSAKKLRDGSIVATTSRGQLVQIDGANGNITKTIQLQQGGWTGVDVLANGNFLVSEMSRNTVKELDRNGKLIKEVTYNGVFRANVMPNGNRLVASMNTRKVAELDRNGKVVWERSTQGRPWNIHFR